MLIEPELKRDEKEFLFYNWKYLTLKEIEKKIKFLTIELRKLYKKQKRLKMKRKYY